MDLAGAAYKMTACFPNEERFGLTSQVRRAAASVPANVAEGWGRDMPGVYVQHLRVAQGSLKELETHVILACRVSLIEESQAAPVLSLADEIGRMLRRMIRSIER